jgi:hypothetical protein
MPKKPIFTPKKSNNKPDIKSDSKSGMKPMQRQTKFKLGNNPVVEVLYPKGKYSKQNIKNLVNDYKKKYKGKSLKLMVSINLPDRGWRSAKQFHVKDNAVTENIYDDEWEDSDQFAIYFWKDSEAAGGKDDKYNDCLFNCISRALNKVILPANCNKASKLKKQLKLNRNELIPINLIPKVEKIFSVKINVTGDHLYTSASKDKRLINLKLENEHYTLSHKHRSSELMRGITNKTQELHMYQKNQDGTLTAYDGVKEYPVTFLEVHKTNHCDRNKVDIQYVNAKSSKTSLKDQYDEFIKDIDDAKDKSNGVIDLYKTSGSIRKCVQKLFFNKTQSIVDPEAISLLEEHWVRKAFQGGIISSNKKEIPQAYYYDINSAYPYYLMCANKSSTPMAQPEFKKLETLPEFYQYGIYRAIIKKSNDYTINNLFRYNDSNYYTHHDLNSAKALGLDIQLILDDECNFMFYDVKSRVIGPHIYKPIIEYLYDLKKQKVKLAKALLNCLWGTLCRRNTIKVNCKQDNNIVQLPASAYLTKIAPYSNNDYVEYSKIGSYFDSPYARMAPFITSLVRKEMTTVMHPHRNNIHRVHTDGFVSDKKLPLELGTDIGQWKIEREGKCIIKNCGAPEWLT